MIKSIKWAIIIFMVVALPLYSSPAENDLASFLAGVIILKSNSTLTPEQKAEKFNELKAITGVEPSEAIKFLEKCKVKPERWKTVFDSITNVITNF